MYSTVGGTLASTAALGLGATTCDLQRQLHSHCAVKAARAETDLRSAMSLLRTDSIDCVSARTRILPDRKLD
jgi:hypothetical protein